MPTELPIRELSPDEIRGLYPCAKILNPDMSEERFNIIVEQMIDDGYRCAAITDDKEVIAICGFWMRTQWFSGRQIEPDNVIVDDKYRSQGIGKRLLAWVEDLAKKEGCESAFLKTYVANTASHKFYYNNGYRILGLGFFKELT